MINMNRRKTAKLFQIINSFALVFIAALCFLPLWHIVSLSLSDKSAIAANQVTLLPVGFQLSSYIHIMGDASFMRAFLVSTGRVVVGTFLSMLVLILAAYPLSMEKEKFFGRDVIMWILYIPTFFGGGLIPSYLLMSSLGLINNPWVLVIGSGLFSITGAILLKNFFRNVPKSISEAAAIDGAGHFQMLIRIFIPLSKACISTLVLFAVVGTWNEWFSGTIFLNDRKWYPLQTYLYGKLNTQIDFVNMTKEELERVSQLSDRSLRAAQIIVSTIPILILYPFVQKHFVGGIIVGSVKE